MSMAPTSEPAATTSQPPLEGDALKGAIKRQAEYYFSKENLASDTYLLSMMDSEFFVPVNVIAGFGKLKALTSDLGLIVEVLKNSEEVVLDESASKVRPKLQQKRSTLILRDIPKDTPIEEIQALFKGSSAPNNIRPDVLNTWFLTFDSEEDTLASLEFLRKGVQFQGKPVRCAIKSESVIKSVYYADARTQQMAQMYSDGSNFGPGGRQWGNRRSGGPGGAGGNRRGGRGQDYGARPSGGAGMATTAGNVGGNGVNGGRNKGQRRPKGREGSGEIQNPGKVPTAPQTQVVLSPMHFPPLPSKGNEKMGYSKDFKKYTKEEMIEIIRATELVKLEGMDQSCVVILQTPDSNLEMERSEEERGRRVSMEFDLTHLATAKQVSAATSSVPTVRETSQEDKADVTPVAKEPAPTTAATAAPPTTPSKVSYAAMASKPKS